MPVYPAHSIGHIPELAARFARTAQCPADSVEKLQWLVFPIAEADSIPDEWRGKTLLELPRVMFGKLEAKTAARLAALKDAGFAGAVVNNPAQLRYTDGWTLYGGLGLNITNPMSAARYTSLGLQGMLLQPETALTAMQAVAPGVPTAALCYGHLPLMLTRACPLRNVHDCASCRGGGTLRDRKGRDFTVTCSAPGGRASAQYTTRCRSTWATACGRCRWIRPLPPLPPRPRSARPRFWQSFLPPNPLTASSPVDYTIPITDV